MALQDDRLGEDGKQATRCADQLTWEGKSKKTAGEEVVFELSPEKLAEGQCLGGFQRWRKEEGRHEPWPSTEVTQTESAETRVVGWERSQESAACA